LEVIIFEPVTPPAVTANLFPSIKKFGKIYVPDASVAAYKAATNWVSYADYIYPVSDLD
jgi:hypothetical protein